LVRKYVTVVLGTVAVASAMVFLTSAGSSAHTSRKSVAPRNAAKITFSVPSVVDPIHTWGEPSINYNIPRDEFFASGPTGTGTQRSMWEGSVDGGHTFRIIVPGPPAAPFDSQPEPTPGGGDTDLAFDRAGNEYFADLYALACNRSAATPNGGATVKQSFNACGLPQYPGSDRQWLAVYDPPPGSPHSSKYKGKKLVYLEFNNLKGPYPNSGAQWLKSTDGLHWSNATAGVTSALDQATYSPFGNDGYPAIDQQTGKVFETAGLPVGYPTKNSAPYNLELNIGTPDSSGQLTFLDHPTSSGGAPNPKKLIVVAKNIATSPDTLFSVLSMDSARNLFVVYATNNPTKPKQDQVFVTAASAASGWTRWTKPVRVSNASTSLGDATNIFPWDKAGGPGRVDAVWYGSNKMTDPSSHTNQKWNVFMSQLVFPVNKQGAVTGAAPKTTLVKVSPHPMHYGDVCLEGTDCILSQGNRNLADFFSVTINRSGAAQIIYDDTSNGLVQPGGAPGGNQSADHAGAPVVTIARQASGMGLYGKTIHATTPAPVSGMSDAAGDARYPVIGGRNVAGMDIRGSSLSLSKDGKTLTVTTKVVKLSDPAATLSTLTLANSLEYVTRWQMGNTLYFAGMSTSGGSPSFYAGKTGSIDLCSVSACFPHVLTYPETSPSFSGSSSTESGKVKCPKSPSAASPCTISITVHTADVGQPTAHSLLEEVGAYAFAAPAPQSSENNATAQKDIVPLEIDGVCCYDFKGTAVRAIVPKPHHHHQHRAHHHTKHHRHHRISRRPKRKHARGFTG
jgi:hypothetical protein